MKADMFVCVARRQAFLNSDEKPYRLNIPVDTTLDRDSD